MSKETSITALAFAYAHATGVLSGALKVLINPVATYTEEEKIELMKKALEEADEIIRKA